MQLIVNADDAGYSSTRDAGIIKGINLGSISDVSVLVNGENHEQFAKWWRSTGRHAPGLHLNLTEGIPVSLDTSVSSLVNVDGLMLGKMGFRQQLRDKGVSLKEVRQETANQIQRFIKCFGEAPSHFDGHQHVHVLPDVRTVIAEEMKSFGIMRTRLPDSPLRNVDWLERNQLNFMRSVVADAAAARMEFSSLGIRASSNFIGLNMMGSHLTISHLRTEMSALPDGALCELMVHPGYCCLPGEQGCGGGVDRFSISTDREHELKILNSASWRQLLDELNVEIVSFREI